HLRTLGIDLFTHAWEQHPDATTPHHALALHITTTHPTPPANLTQTLTHAFDLADPHPPAVQIYTALTSDPGTDALLQDALTQHLGQLPKGTLEYNRVKKALNTHNLAQTTNTPPPAGPTTAHTPPKPATTTAANQAFTTLTTTPTPPNDPNHTPTPPARAGIAGAS
ncbi:hypothetical protein ACIOWI_37300, partial [Streptomyces sp. NPDC087659]